MSPASANADLRAEPDGRGGLSLHATTVALNGRALVITGASGAGKSALAAGMIVLGARLVADDLTILRDEGGVLEAAAAPPADGRIELRGLGLVRAAKADAAAVAAVLTLGPSGARLPVDATVTLLGHSVRHLRHPADPSLAAKAMLWLRDAPSTLQPAPARRPITAPRGGTPASPAGPGAHYVTDMTDDLRSKADPAPLDLLLVTGPSGAGRTTAIHALEDMGREAIDNLPLSMLRRLLIGSDKPLALGIDARNRDFSVDGLIDALRDLHDDPGIAHRLLYLDCAPDVLVTRFSETRRRHPLAPFEDVVAGIARERDLMAPLIDHSDVIVDTSAMTPHDLKAEVARWFGPAGRTLAISIQSFSFKRGLPRGLDMAFDVRFLRNPHWVPDLRDGTGRDPAVRDHVAGDPAFAPFFDRTSDLILSLLPAFRDEGRAHLAIGFGCTGGRHRSVALSEMTAAALAAAGWPVSIRHRELDRRGGASVPQGSGGPSREGSAA